MLALCLPAAAGELVILSTGAQLAAERVERVPGLVRLHTATGLIELPAATVSACIRDDRPAPSAPAPTAPAPAATPPANPRTLINEAAERYGLPPALLHSVARTESDYSPGAVSHKGAIGVMQLMPGTARWLASDVVGRSLDPHQLADNIEGGVAYIAWLSRHAGSTRRVIASYYQGLASLRARGPYDDTVAYVASVLALRGRV